MGQTVYSKSNDPMKSNENPIIIAQIFLMQHIIMVQLEIIRDYCVKFLKHLSSPDKDTNAYNTYTIHIKLFVKSHWVVINRRQKTVFCYFVPAVNSVALLKSKKNLFIGLWLWYWLTFYIPSLHLPHGLFLHFNSLKTAKSSAIVHFISAQSCFH